MTLDGVMQAPGGPEEDQSGGFKYGGWSVPYWDDILSDAMGEQMGRPYDLLLGRKTYDVFAGAWPTLDQESEINSSRKYVVTHRPIPPDTEVWKNSVRIDGDVVTAINRIKAEEGPDIQVHGSSVLAQTLLNNDLADELWLKIYPVTLGSGKRLFGEGAVPKAFTLTDSKVSPTGVIVANFARKGEVETSSFA
jgi:dihydrofolate reductase